MINAFLNTFLQLVLRYRPILLHGRVLVKILIPLLAMVSITTASASIIGVMDSGTDISHKDLVFKKWYNSKERAGSLVDLDGDGLPGNINGWDFTANSPKVFDDQYNYLITEDVKTFYNYYSKYELGLLNAQSPEIAWLKENTQNKELMNKVDFVGGYIHGTHVAGIAVKNLNRARVLSFKILPTVYQELPAEALKNVARTNTLVELPADNTPTMTLPEFVDAIVEEAIRQIQQMTTLNAMMGHHKADAVNQSFGIGTKDAINFLTRAFIGELKREPTQQELIFIFRAYFTKLLSEGPKMFAAAPKTLFVIAAGNDSSDNDKLPDYPANIKAENKLVVAATLGYRSLAEFSNYGATTVDVAAPGVAINSAAPTQAYIPLSGTSQAAPFVTNVIAAMKDLNHGLSTRDLKAIILGTVDKKEWLAGKVRTGGIINKARALRAAELAKSRNIDLAISTARATVADVAVEKSFFKKPAGLNIDFKVSRPSLLIVK